MIVLPLLFAAASPAMCHRLPLTAAERAADSAVIRRRPGQPIRASEISDVMAEGRWKAIWATPAEAERGVYFLRRDTKGRWRVSDVWGGVIAADERAGTIAWAREHNPGLPPGLANCFVDALLVGK